MNYPFVVWCRGVRGAGGGRPHDHPRLPGLLRRLEGVPLDAGHGASILILISHDTFYPIPLPQIMKNSTFSIFPFEICCYFSSPECTAELEFSESFANIKLTSLVGQVHRPINYEDTKPVMSSFLVFNRV